MLWYFWLYWIHSDNFICWLLLCFKEWRETTFSVGPREVKQHMTNVIQPKPRWSSLLSDDSNLMGKLSIVLLLHFLLQLNVQHILFDSFESPSFSSFPLCKLRSSPHHICHECFNGILYSCLQSLSNLFKWSRRIALQYKSSHFLSLFPVLFLYLPLITIKFTVLSIIPHLTISPRKIGVLVSFFHGCKCWV